MDLIALFLVWIFLTGSLVAGQIGYDPLINGLVCSKLGGTYCSGKSMESNTVIACASVSVAKIYSCNMQLMHVLPDAYKNSSLCYQSSEEAGDAVCAFNGTGYNLDGSSFSLPETFLSNLDPLGFPIHPTRPLLSTISRGSSLSDLITETVPFSPMATSSDLDISSVSNTEPTTATVNEECPASTIAQTSTSSSKVWPTNLSSQTKFIMSFYATTIYSTETIRIILAVTRTASPTSQTIYPISVTTMTIGDPGASISSSKVESTIFGTKTQTASSAPATANAAPVYIGQAAFLGMLAFAGAFF